MTDGEAAILIHAKRLVGILEHPQPGLITWETMRNQTVFQLRDALIDITTAVIAKPEAPAESEDAAWAYLGQGYQRLIDKELDSNHASLERTSECWIWRSFKSNNLVAYGEVRLDPDPADSEAHAKSLAEVVLVRLRAET